MRLRGHEAVLIGGEIMFRLQRAQSDRETQRAYVELRASDDDGGEVLSVVIFSFKTTASLSKQQVKEDIVRKARHLLKEGVSGSRDRLVYA